ncbi:DNA-directed DNA polymerase, partial [Powellomyces hirtus]
TKEAPLPSFKIFAAADATETGCSPKVLQSDHGGEYLSKGFSNFTQSLGIRHQLSSVATPQQSGVAERMNRTLVGMARCLLLQAGLPYKFWGEALMTAAYLRNRSPTQALHNKATPWQNWTGTRPNTQHLCIFCCTAYASILKKNQHKLGPNATRCIFLVYSQATKGYRLWNEAAGKLIESRDVWFDEESFAGGLGKPDPAAQASTDMADKLSDAKDELSQQGEPAPVGAIPSAPRKPKTSKVPERSSTRIQQPPQEYWKSGTGLLAETTGLLAEAIAPGEDEPACLKAALKASDTRQWEQAAQTELNSLHKGVDYGETFAPAARFSSVRKVLAIAAIEDMELEEMDAVTAFLNPDIDQEFYMEQPEGFAILGRSTWFADFVAASGLCAEQCRAQYPKSTLYLRVYVANMILASKSMVQIKHIKAELSKQLRITDMGALGLFLSVEITRDHPSHHLWLSQEHYLQKIPASFGMDNYKPQWRPPLA